MSNDFTIGITKCQVGLGLTYFEGGKDVAIDYEKSMHWFTLAVEGKSSVASFYLGVHHKEGLGVNKNYLEAMKWFVLSEDLGYSQALYKIGVLFYNGGYGIESNFPAALAVFQGYIDNCKDIHCKVYFYIGNIFEKGSNHVQYDYVMSMSFYLQAFSSGHASSASSIGLLYHEGLGVNKNKDKEFEWYSKAAAMGCPVGHHSLGVIYLRGYVRGTTGLKLALNHFKRALEGGYVCSGPLVTKVETMLLDYDSVNF